MDTDIDKLTKEFNNYFTINIMYKKNIHVMKFSCMTLDIKNKNILNIYIYIYMVHKARKRKKESLLYITIIHFIIEICDNYLNFI